MTSGPWTLMNATRSSVPFWISASRAVTVSKPSFSRAERMASITSSRFNDTPTAVPQQNDGPRRGPLSRTKNIFYGSYINCCVLTILVQEDYDAKHSDRLREGDQCLRFMTPAARGPPTTSHSPLAPTT